MKEHSITKLRQLLEKTDHDEELRKIQLDINKTAIGFIHSRIRLIRTSDGYHMLVTSVLPPEILGLIGQMTKKQYGLKLSHIEHEEVRDMVPTWQRTKPAVMRRVRAAKRGMLYKLTSTSKKPDDKSGDQKPAEVT